MITLKRLALSTSAAATGLALTAGKAFAQIGDFLGPVPDISGTGGDPEDLRIAILNVLQDVLMFMGLVAVVFIVVAGIRLIVSQGDDTQKETAKKTITYVIVGLILIILASAIVSFVIGLLD